LAVDRDDEAQLVAPLVRPGHAWVGSLVSDQFPHIKTKTQFVEGLTSVAQRVDVLIDFSLPEFSEITAQRCAELKIPIVIGTTGFSYQQKNTIGALSDRIPVLMAPNMSVGVNLCLKLLQLAAKTLGAKADIEIIEAHHRYKKDAPSGTALRMGEAIAEGMGRVFSELAAFDRCGKDAIRKPGSIGFSAIRAGNIVGEHTALFALAGEEIEITHKARDRQTFAQGALAAAKWLSSQPPGRYDMMDVLGLRDES
jgi:4-hydroxy-tetrahydrodipicolinate reductase